MEQKVDAIVKKTSRNSPISSGIVYIFVHEEFEEYESRYGAQTDVSYIQKCFKLLGLTVMDPYINYTASQVIHTLDQASRSDFSEYECFIIIIITHFFKLGELLSKRGNYREDDVINYFKGNRCPGLIGKPKMFFFQASKCQERQLTKTNTLCTDGTSTFIPKFTLPNEADIFAFRSSYEGGPSHKPESTGSWVVKNLCQRMENLDGSVSLLEAVTTLLNDIKSNRSGGPSQDSYKTLPEMTSSLIQHVYFKNSSLTCISNPPVSYTKGKKMGRFYVFNYNKVYDSSTREFLKRDGTEKDTAYIEQCFTSLGFEVKVEDDLPKDDLFKILKEAPDFTEDTCVAVAILTHGIDGLLGTFDYPFSEQELYNEFSFKKRPDLTGKPKIFFLQVCRGDKITGHSTVEYVGHEENTKINFSEDDIHVESTISDEKKRHSKVLTDGCEINFKTVTFENEYALKSHDTETKLKSHMDMESLEVSRGDVKSDSTVVDIDCLTSVSGFKGTTTVHEFQKITCVNDLRKGITITRDGKIVTTVGDIDGNTTVDTTESSTNIGNEDEITAIDDLKSFIDVKDSVCNTSTVADESSCATTASVLDGVTTVFNKKIFTSVSDVEDVAKNMSRNIETDAKPRVKPIFNEAEAQYQSPTGSAQKNILPLEDDDTLVVHSTYAQTPSHRDTKSGSWFIQDICKHLELLTRNQEISLLDAVFEVQKYVAENREATIDNELHKQMPVISSTLTQRLMIGPSTKLSI